ncbi:Uncharacterized protein T12_10285, partial [Trichinella patagoniensis]
LDKMSAALPNALSAKYRNSFAYTTIKDRLPVILTKVIDTLHCSRCQFASTDNPQEGSIDCVRQAIGHLSELRYKLSTDKALTNIEDNLNDALMWNNSLSEYRGKYNLDPTWFTAPWLLCECYFYRKIWEIINTNLPIKDWDPFAKQKEQSWLSTYATIESLAKMFNETMLSFCNCASLEQARPHIEDIVQFALWGNKCDLSLSCGEAVHEAKALDMLFLKKLEKFILINNMPALFSYLQRSTTKPNSTVDIILDNVGLELFADLCLADTLLQLKLASKVRFHAKPFPFFVSDTTEEDFLLTLNNLNNQQDGNVKLLSSRWSTFLKNGTFVLTKHTFWTSPYAYYEMQRIAPDLYEELEKSNLLIFKGDLNYRKLVGDLNWPPTTPFEQALIGFKPCPILALRTVKADTVAGLKPGQSEQLTATDPHWMISGEYVRSFGAEFSPASIEQFCTVTCLNRTEIQCGRLQRVLLECTLLSQQCFSGNVDCASNATRLGGQLVTILTSKVTSWAGVDEYGSIFSQSFQRVGIIGKPKCIPAGDEIALNYRRRLTTFHGRQL